MRFALLGLCLVPLVSLSLSCKKSEITVPGPYGIDARPANPTCKAFARPTSSAVKLHRQWPNAGFSAPIAIRQAPGDKSRFYVVEQAGRVFSVGVDQSSTRTTVLDITDRVEDGGEAGLLGIDFSPSFATNGLVYLSYTASGTGGNPLESRISEFKSNDNGATIDKSTERILLRVDQPYSNHNGGNVLFGPDGLLYIGFGDGGSGGDPENRAQNVNTLLGKMLRIDVASKAGGKEYAIPASNPFAGGGGSPEIFAVGLRNPWRWSFDRLNGKLWVGDVGQNAYEEIDVVELGKNYGWRGKEGTHCYIQNECTNAAFIDPVAEHGRSEASSITGGYVYRGTAIPSLVGKYVYGDFASGNMWSFVADGNPQTPQRLLSDVGNIASFGEDADGEIYVALFDGTIQKIVPVTGGSSDGAIPLLLSMTGCTSPADVKQPASGLIPFGVNAPLWSDGAEKARWLALPDGETIGITDAGDFDFPNGTVLMKEFRLGGKRIETRLFVRHDDGKWAGYSYEWRDDESDAALLPDGKTKQIGAQTWTYPSRSDCLRCHTEAAGFSLGLELGQQNGDYTYPGGTTANQLATLHHIGVLALGEAPSKTVAYPSYASTAPIADRARAYLHSNCSNCHRPGGPTPTTIDLRYATAFGETNTCGQLPSAGSLGVTDAQLIKAGAPTASIVPLRMRATDAARMPPLGSRVVDADGVALIEQFITSLTECP